MSIVTMVSKGVGAYSAARVAARAVDDSLPAKIAALVPHAIAGPHAGDAGLKSANKAIAALRAGDMVGASRHGSVAIAQFGIASRESRVTAQRTEEILQMLREGHTSV